MSIFSRALLAETYKLRRTPILWLSLIGGAFVSLLIFCLYFFKVEELAKPDQNPWLMYVNISVTLISTLLLTPYVVMATATVHYPEHHSNTWKYLYTLPLAKHHFYFSKLTITLLLTALTYLIFLLTALLGGWVLGYTHPEYGFFDYRPPFGELINILIFSYISCLGMVALHFWLSIRWKSFITPVGIGLLGFILAVIVTGKTKLALYFPYSFVLYKAFLSDGKEPAELGIQQWGPLTNVEWVQCGFLRAICAGRLLGRKAPECKVRALLTRGTSTFVRWP